MILMQDQSSHQRVTEIDPVNVAEILASVGGFWGERRRSGKNVNSTGLREMPPSVFIPPVMMIYFARLWCSL